MVTEARIKKVLVYTKGDYYEEDDFNSNCSSNGRYFDVWCVEILHGYGWQ